MEMVDTELEPVTNKFQIHMMRYYGIQRMPVGWYGSSTSRSCAYFMAERYRKSRFSLVVTFTYHRFRKV